MQKTRFLLTLSFLSAAHALPTGGVVESNSGAIRIDGSSMVIEQTTHKANIDWQNFNIAAGESVHFSQPSIDAVALNRISDPSVINGSLSATGHVYLMSDSGITITDSAVIDVPALFVNAASVDAAGQVHAEKLGIEAEQIKLNGVINTPKSALDAQIHVTGNAIEIGGLIDASADNVGGEVLVSASHELKVTGEINANGSQGGLIGLGSPNRQLTGSISVAGEDVGWIYNGANHEYVKTLRNPASGTRAIGMYHFESMDDGKTFVSRGFDTPAVFSASEALLFKEDNKFALDGVQWQGEGKLNSYSNHYGNGPYKEFNPHFSKIRAKNAFDGVDLLYYYNNRGQLEHDMIVAPGADTSNIQWRIEGASLEQGNIVKGDFKQLAPLAYQDEGTYKNIIESSYVTNANGFTVELGSFDTTKELIIDPTVEHHVYYSGATSAVASPFTIGDVNKLSNGDIVFYLKTNKDSTPPTQDAGKGFYSNATSSDSESLFLAVFNADLNELRYATFITSDSTSTPVVLGVGEGGFYVAGRTENAIEDVPAAALVDSFNNTKIADTRGVFVANFANDGTMNKIGYIEESNFLFPSKFLANDSAVYLTGKSRKIGANITGYATGTYPFTTTAPSGNDETFISRFPLDLSGITTRTIETRQNTALTPIASDSRGKIIIAAMTRSGQTFFLDNGTVADSEGDSTQRGALLLQIEPDAAMTPIFATTIRTTGNFNIYPRTVNVDTNDNIVFTGELGGNGVTTPDIFLSPGALNIGDNADSTLVRSYSKDGALLSSMRIGGDEYFYPSANTDAKGGARILLVDGDAPGNYTSQVLPNLTSIVNNSTGNSLDNLYLLRLSSDYKSVDNAYFIRQQVASSGAALFNDGARVYFLIDAAGSINQVDTTGDIIPGFTRLTKPGGAGGAFTIGYANFDDPNFFNPSAIVTTTKNTTTNASTLPNSVLTIVITQKDGSQIVTKQVQSVNLTKETVPLTLNDALVRNNLSKTDIKDVSIDDGNGIWVYENGKWRYKRR